MLDDRLENDSQVQRRTIATVRNGIKLATTPLESNYTNYDPIWVKIENYSGQDGDQFNRSGTDYSNVSHGMVENAQDDYCSSYINFTYEPLLLAACGVFLIVGLVYSFFGYRLYKIVLFSTGFLYGSVLLYLLCEKEHLLDNSYYNALVACFIGLLIGLITCLVQYVGIFMLGFLTGLLLCLPIFLIWICNSPAAFTGDRPWLAVFGAFFVFGSICALLSLKFQKFSLKFCTSFLGGFFLLLFVDYLATKFRLVAEVKANIFDTRPLEWRRFCWFNWAILAIWPSISFLGFVVQCTVTGVGFSHKSEPHQRRRLRSGHNSRSSTTTTTIANNGRSNGGSGSNIITARCTDCYLYHSAGDKCQSPTVHSSSNCNGNGSLLTSSSSLKRQNQKTSKFSGGKNSSSKQDLTSTEAGAGQYPKKSFRYLYQARRRHGDVICQSYMESLQKLSNQRRFGTTSADLNTPTMISDRTQLTILSTGSNSNSNGSV